MTALVRGAEANWSIFKLTCQCECFNLERIMGLTSWLKSREIYFNKINPYILMKTCDRWLIIDFFSNFHISVVSLKNKLASSSNLYYYQMTHENDELAPNNVALYIIYIVHILRLYNYHLNISIITTWMHNISTK